jgi:putative membrane protein
MGDDMMGYGGMMGWGGGGGGYGLLGMLPMLLWWVVVIVAIVIAVRWLASGRIAHGAGDDALRILRERLARGEIGKEEFDERKRDLA